MNFNLAAFSILIDNLHRKYAPYSYDMQVDKNTFKTSHSLVGVDLEPYRGRCILKKAKDKNSQMLQQEFSHQRKRK